ncbi:HPP family protein [Xanthobacter lutulentifluminis]|uniref:HPP family protein n=1 Tax=Xanthobacter lutulentifluminis TaxID=3119935 RepID=UPI004040B1A9
MALWGWQGLGGAMAVAGMEVAAHLGETPLALIPFATSIVLVLGLPETEAAQPRALVGGHVISAAVGLAMLALFGRSEPAAAAAVGLAMVAMRTTRTVHPPAAINPIIVVMEAMKPGFLLAPVLVGALMLAGYAWAWHNLARPRSWPSRWW